MPCAPTVSDAPAQGYISSGGKQSGTGCKTCCCHELLLWWDTARNKCRDRATDHSMARLHRQHKQLGPGPSGRRLQRCWEMCAWKRETAQSLVTSIHFFFPLWIAVSGSLVLILFRYFILWVQEHSQVGLQSTALFDHFTWPECFICTSLQEEICLNIFNDQWPYLH